MDTKAFSVFPSYLEIVRWIHLHQQSIPSSLLLKPVGIGRPLSVQTTTLNKEAFSLQHKWLQFVSIRQYLLAKIIIIMFVNYEKLKCYYFSLMTAKYPSVYFIQNMYSQLLHNSGVMIMWIDVISSRKLGVSTNLHVIYAWITKLFQKATLKRLEKKWSESYEFFYFI